MLDLVSAKAICMTILASVSLLIGFIPLKLGRMVGWAKDGIHSKRSDIVTSITLCFGGGVLIAVCIVHMMPEVRNNLEMYAANGNSSNHNHDHGQKYEVPMAEILFCCGFFMVFLLEELVLAASVKEPALQESTTELKRTFSMRGQANKNKTKASPKNNNVKQDEKLDPDPEDTTDSAPKLEDANKISVFDELNAMDGNPEYNPKYEVKLRKNEMFPNYHPTYEEKKIEKSARKMETMNRIFNCCKQVKNTGSTISKSLKDDDGALKSPFSCSNVSSKNVLTVLALSFHSIFEAMAIGLESSIYGVWKVFAAIAIHKFVITFCVALDLVNSETTRLCSYISYMIVFCLVSPIGVAIGTTVVELSKFSGQNHHFTVGILQGLSAGTILYVVVFEVLQREKTRKKIPGLIQLLFVILGFAIMLSIEVLGSIERNIENVQMEKEEVDLHPPLVEASENHTHVN